MSILSPKIFSRISKSYRRSYGIDIQEFDCDGICSESDDPLLNLQLLNHGRAHALREAVRWGEAYQYLALPNVINWVIPIVKGKDTLCGLSGGMVLTDKDADDRLKTVNRMTESGCCRQAAESWYDALPLWTERPRMQKAAEFLFALTCCEIKWDMLRLSVNRENAYRQRKIAEEVHRRKSVGADQGLMDEERTLLALVQAGDKRGARRELNRMLGALFSHTADMRLIKAHVIEMMGHLVRNAVESNPSISPLIEKNHHWMGNIIDADNFESLSNLIAEAMEDYLDNVYLQSRSGTNENVAKILSYLSDHFDERVTLDMLAEHAGLSTFRVAHLVKEVTGNTVQQHLRRLRIQRAVDILEKTDTSCTEIAQEVGFCDQSYFIKQFKRQMGITPSRYRRLYASTGRLSR